MPNKKSFGPKPIGAPKSGIIMKTETANKIGLFGAISVIVGAIIGVGIFFKNGGVFRNNNGNAWGVLLSWILVFIIAFATAFSYGEVSKAKTKAAGSGLAGWIERYIGYRTGRFIKLAYPMFYYSIYVIAMCTFAAEAIVNIFPNSESAFGSIDNMHFGYVLLIAIGLAIVFIGLNLISSSLTPKMSNYLSLIKFIPITLVVVGGVWSAIANGWANNLFKHPGMVWVPDNVSQAPTLTGQFSLVGVFASLPAIMFAFDSFLIVGSIQHSVKNPTKTVPLSIVLSMSLCGILYALITIAQIICGCGDPYTVFASLQIKIGNSAVIVFSIIIGLLLFLSLFGVCNSIILAAVRSCQAAINEEVIVGSKWFKKISNGKRSDVFGGCVLTAIFSAIWFIVGGIPSLILNTDQVIDGLSNLVVVVMFFVYGVVPLFSLPRWCKVSEKEVPHVKSQYFTAPLGFLGCTFVVGYSMFYSFLTVPIQNKYGEFKTWGLFFKYDHAIPNWAAALIFWGTGLLFIVLPLLNDLLIKLTDKSYNQRLIWEPERASTRA